MLSFHGTMKLYDKKTRTEYMGLMNSIGSNLMKAGDMFGIDDILLFNPKPRLRKGIERVDMALFHSKHKLDFLTDRYSETFPILDQIMKDYFKSINSWDEDEYQQFLYESVTKSLYALPKNIQLHISSMIHNVPYYVGELFKLQTITTKYLTDKDQFDYRIWAARDSIGMDFWYKGLKQGLLLDDEGKFTIKPKEKYDIELMNPRVLHY